MILYLSGGFNPAMESEVELFYNNLKQALLEQQPKQILHLPFARTGIYTKNREVCFRESMKPLVEGLGIEYLDARHIEDYEKAQHPMLIINGGNDVENLHHQIISYEPLKKLLYTAPCIFGDSSGAIVLGKSAKKIKPDWRGVGLGMVECLVVPHYSEWAFTESDRKELLRSSGTNIFGIDENTIIKTTSENIHNYTVFGKGDGYLYSKIQ